MHWVVWGREHLVAWVVAHSKVVHGSVDVHVVWIVAFANVGRSIALSVTSPAPVSMLRFFVTIVISTADSGIVVVPHTRTFFLFVRGRGSNSDIAGAVGVLTLAGSMPFR